MRLMSATKLGVKPDPTLKHVTQSTIGVGPQLFRLRPRLSKYSYLKVYLEGHVILSHFRNVNILVDITYFLPF